MDEGLDAQALALAGLHHGVGLEGGEEVGEGFRYGLGMKDYSTVGHKNPACG